MFNLKKLSLTSLLFASLLSASAMADGYWGVNLAIFDIGDQEPLVLEGKFGTYVYETGPFSIAAEGRLGLGVASDNGFDIDYLLGGYARGEYNNTSPFTPYALLGLTYLKGSNRFGTSDSDVELTAGIGVNYAYSDIMAFNFELDDIDDAKSYNFGIEYKF